MGVDIYELLLGMGASPATIQRLMQNLQTQNQAPLFNRAPWGMRGDLARRAPAASRPTGIYQGLSAPQRGR